MGLFDTSALLTSNLGVGETKRTPLPIADAVLAQLGKPVFQEGTSSKTGEPWLKLNVPCTIADSDFLTKAGVEKATLTYGIMLDTENGAIALGKNRNIKLGKLREAAGVNGQPLERLEGQFVKVKIGHRPDPDDASIVYDEIVGVVKA